MRPPTSPTRFLSRFSLWMVAGVLALVGLLLVILTSPPYDLTKSDQTPAVGAGTALPRQVERRGTQGTRSTSVPPASTPAPVRRSAGSMILPEQWAEAMGWQVDGEIAPGSHSGQLVLARVTTSKGTQTLAPNQAGNFERLYVSPQERIEVALLYPEAVEGDAIVVEVNDGGRLANGSIVDTMRLDAHRSLRFPVWVTEAFGTHRVVLYHTGDLKVLDFWVGDHEIPPELRRPAAGVSSTP